MPTSRAIRALWYIWWIFSKNSAFVSLINNDFVFIRVIEVLQLSYIQTLVRERLKKKNERIEISDAFRSYCDCCRVTKNADM